MSEDLHPGDYPAVADCLVDGADRFLESKGNGSAWCGWCVREGVLSTHYANREAAREPLPEGEDRSVRD